MAIELSACNGPITTGLASGLKSSENSIGSSSRSASRRISSTVLYLKYRAMNGPLRYHFISEQVAVRLTANLSIAYFKCCEQPLNLQLGRAVVAIVVDDRL